MTSDLLVIVPSRGRPAAAAEVAQAFRETCADNTRLVFAVDEDDPTAPSYVDVLRGYSAVVRSTGTPSTMVKALNEAAAAYADQAYALGFMGDDHRPRTYGWDGRYLDALDELGTGIVYGDDLLQHERIPTQVAMTADIVRTLGHMAPPSLVHLAVDNWWKELGEGAGCLRYLPGVVIEHLHPFAGKAPMDEGYQRVNAPAMYRRDLAEFARLQADELPGAIAKVRALRGALR